MKETQDVTNQKPLTEGEKAVRININSDNQEVYHIKKWYAELIDVLIEKRTKSTISEVGRDYSIAITDAENSCMRAVRALTYPY